ncbi:LacI family DNA-binding transcriptional regulator [Streptomyces sp. NPDC090499]|uniref:LacI family DNA-binding transcriptional regulator n=1 Tax=Streptomyces sp. NPDC090499 TaxID=3365965 RepID=UPI0037FA9719
MARSGRVTLTDVAEASGVSRATVSFVLNDDPRQTISTATRERVLAAARDLGYVPHGIARALREGSSRIVVLNVDHGLEGNFSRSYVLGLDEELAAHDHVLLVRHGRAAPENLKKIWTPSSRGRSSGSVRPTCGVTSPPTRTGSADSPSTPACRSGTSRNAGTVTSPWPCPTMTSR